MKAVVINAPHNVALVDRPMPVCQDPTDVVIKVELAALCGSDLHVYRGHQKGGFGFIMGHELVGHVHEIGSGVKSFKVGDYVVCPFTISCGDCYYCARGHTGRCTSSKLLGSPLLDGAQAEYIRIPLGESTLFQAPTTIPKEVLIIMADIFPTGYFVAKKGLNLLQEAEGKGQKEDTTCVVIGCGPVGLCAITAASEFFTNVYAIDSVPARLSLAKKHGASETFNFQDSTIDYLATIKSLTGGRGADVALEVVGHPSALQTAVDVVRPHGVISSCGVHTHPVELKGPDLYNKNLRFDFGRCPVRALFGEALKMLEKKQDLFKGFVENVVPVEECQEWYEKFEKNQVQKTAFRMSSSSSSS